MNQSEGFIEEKRNKLHSKKEWHLENIKKIKTALEKTKDSAEIEGLLCSFYYHQSSINRIWTELFDLVIEDIEENRSLL